jgi:hypothetical protein
VNWNKSRSCFFIHIWAIWLSQEVPQFSAPYSTLSVIVACLRLCPDALYIQTQISFTENASSVIPALLSRSVYHSGLEQAKTQLQDIAEHPRAPVCMWLNIYLWYWIISFVQAGPRLSRLSSSNFNMMLQKCWEASTSYSYLELGNTFLAWSWLIYISR